MNRIALLLASTAVAAAACLLVLYARREPPVAAPAPAASSQPAHSGPALAAPAPAPDPSAPEVDADFVRELARAEAAREEALRDAIVKIGDDESLALDARLERFREAVKGAGGKDPGTATFVTPSMLAEIFLRSEGVQRELAAMSPAARAGELAHIRREFGFDEEQIAHMAEIDERREARWENGLAYMKERERIAATFDGDALETELDALREEYFAHEAPTIEAEEREGFFRFERPRIYGRN